MASLSAVELTRFMLAETYPEAGEDDLEAAARMIVAWANDGVVDVLDTFDQDEEVSALTLEILMLEIEMAAGVEGAGRSFAEARRRLNILRPGFRLPWRGARDFG